MRKLAVVAGLFALLVGFASKALADSLLYDFNVSYSNIHENVPNAGTPFSDIDVSARAQFAGVTSFSDFSNPEFGFEDTRLMMNLIDTELEGGPFPTSWDWSGLDTLRLGTSYSVDNFGGEVFIDRRAQITFVETSPSSATTWFQLGNVQIVSGLTEVQYNDMSQMLLSEDPLSFTNQFLSMDPHITPFNAYRYDPAGLGGWSAWWSGSQSSFALVPEPTTGLLLGLGLLGLAVRRRV